MGKRICLFIMCISYLDMAANATDTPTPCAPCICKLEEGMHLAICNNTAMHLSNTINFSSVMRKMTKKVQGIQMIQFPLSEITKTLFDKLDFDNLTDFSIIQCSLYKIVEYAFDHHSLHNIESLSLSGNEISELENGSFGGLKKLKYLRLDHNKLSELNSNQLFSGCPLLEEINLSFNDLTYISPDLFVGNKAIKQIDISENSLHSFDYELIMHLNLTFLFVNNNPWDCYLMRNTSAIIIKQTFYDGKGICTYPKEFNNSSWAYYSKQYSVDQKNSNLTELETESSNVGLIVGLTILAIVIIAVIFGVGYLIYKKKCKYSVVPTAEQPTNK